MAREYLQISLNIAQKDVAVITTYPYTMATWFYLYAQPAANDYNALMAILDKDQSISTGVGMFSTLNITGSNYANKILLSNGNTTGGYAEAITSTAHSTGVWSHACGVAASATSRNAYLNGGGKGTNATNVTQSGYDRIMMSGYNDAGGVGDYIDGILAETCWWSAALDDTEVAALAAGACPLGIRPESIEHYVDQVRLIVDQFEPTAWTVTTTGVVQAQPLIIYPAYMGHRVSKQSSAPAAPATPASYFPGRRMFSWMEARA